MDQNTRLLQRPCVTAVALEELRILAGSGTQEGDVAAAEVEQVPGGVVTALVVVRAHRQPGLPGLHRAPQHEVRALSHQPLETLAVLQVVAVAEQDQAVGPVAVLIFLVPVPRLLLERDEQVIAALRTGARDGAQHRDEKRIDRGVVRRGVFEDEEGKGVGALEAQVRGILVNRVVQLLRDCEHPLARRLAHLRAAPQRARHRRLGHPGLIGNIKRRSFRRRPPVSFLATHSPVPPLATT